MSKGAVARVLMAALAAIPLTVLLLPVFIIALGLCGFAWCVRSLGRRLEPQFVDWEGLIAFDPALGWKPLPNLDAWYLVERDDVYRTVTDGEGWPGRRPLEQSAIVAIGDSFAFGYGVDTHRSFADVNPRLPVKAVGAPGYSMVHGVRLMEQLGSRLAGKVVVWMIYLENDLQDSLAPELRRYRVPFVRETADGGWEIVDSHVNPTRWRASLLDTKRLFPHFCVPGPLADRAYAAADYLIERAHDACSRHSARLVVMTVPDPIQLSPDGVARLRVLSGKPDACDENLPDRRIAESCARHRVPMIIGKDHVTALDYKPTEGIHWNERGHRRTAQVLERVYNAFQSGALDELIPRGFAVPAGSVSSPRRLVSRESLHAAEFGSGR
jgi:hypothetical protein